MESLPSTLAEEMFGTLLSSIQRRQDLEPMQLCGKQYLESPTFLDVMKDTIFGVLLSLRFGNHLSVEETRKRTSQKCNTPDVLFNFGEIG